MSNLRKRKNKLKRLNLIPILDAVFIFIFFLLMSAQFVDIHEIGSDAPAVSTITNDEKDKRPPLNLVLEINKKAIIVKTGLEGYIQKTIPIQNKSYDLKTLAETLRKIKSENMDEQSIIFRPKQNVEYEKLVKIMDAVRNIAPGTQKIAGKNKSGKVVQTDSMFEQIIFETII